jgi:molecular chaperone GrpE
MSVSRDPSADDREDRGGRDGRSGDRAERPALVVRDRRRIDPVTLEPRRAASRETSGAGRAEGGADPASLKPRDSGQHGVEPPRIEQLRDRLAESTADLQRLKAEYDNYRKRVARDRLAIREIAVSNVLAGLLPALDAVEFAREHGAVTGGFQAVAEVLETQLSELGLRSVGEPGEPFDPQTHEAITYITSEDATGPVCTAVARRGYRVGDQLLRPAQVTVTGPPVDSALGREQR